EGEPCCVCTGDVARPFNWKYAPVGQVALVAMYPEGTVIETELEGSAMLPVEPLAFMIIVEPVLCVTVASPLQPPVVQNLFAELPVFEAASSDWTEYWYVVHGNKLLIVVE